MFIFFIFISITISVYCGVETSTFYNISDHNSITQCTAQGFEVRENADGGTTIFLTDIGTDLPVKYEKIETNMTFGESFDNPYR